MNYLMTLILYHFYFYNIVQSATYYVDSEASSSGSGSSWNDAFKNLEDALNQAYSNDLIYLMGNRTYTPRSSHRDDCFIVPENVFIYGGFQSKQETSHSSRSSSPNGLYESIISGNIGNKATNEDNCYHVIRYNRIITLDRISIEDGNANYEYSGPETREDLNGFGGGLITNNILESQTITIRDSIFKNNEALGGSALWFGSSDGNIGNSVNVIIHNSIFIQNKAYDGKYEGGYGGAIYAYNNVVIVAYTVRFENNYASFRGGAIYQGYGGSFQCTTCEFMSNKVGAYGGALFNERDVTPWLQTSTTVFEANYADVYGGGIMLLDGINGQITQSTFSYNAADYKGGAEALMWSTNTGTGNVYQNNDPDNTYYEQETIYSEIDPTVDFGTLNEHMLDIWRNYGDYFNDIAISLDVGGGTCYVNNGGPNTGIGGGDSWFTAYNEIQDCLDQLRFTGGEVWVAGHGHYAPYYPTGYREGSDGNNVDKTFTIYPLIRMYGGFDGSETRKYQRNFHKNPTYLSGNVNGELVNNLIMPDDYTLIDGFYIGEAGCSNGENNLGGGIYSDGKRFYIANSIFYGLCATISGGAIYCSQSEGDEWTVDSFTPHIRNVLFWGNTAGWDGGAIFSGYRCDIQCRYCNFEENRASRRGGAVYSEKRSDLSFEYSNFTENYALHSGGCVAVEELSNVTFTCPIFSYNQARWEGGCLYSGYAQDLQYHMGEYTQGFLVHGTYHTFMDNQLYDENSDTWNNGQPNVYLGPFSDYCFYYDEDCHEGDHPAYQPTPYPTEPPQEPPYRECGDCWSGLYNEIPVEIPFSLHMDSEVIIRSCLSNFETILEIRDTNGNLRERALDGCKDNDNAQISTHLYEGLYTIRVIAKTPPVKNGVYNILIVCPPPPSPMPTTKPPHTRPPGMTKPPGTKPPQTTTPQPSEPDRVFCCEDSFCDNYKGQDVEFKFDMSIYYRPTKVIISTCRSNMDTKLRVNGFGIYSECDDCGTNLEPGDCFYESELEEDEGTCCSGDNEKAAELTHIMNPGMYYVTLMGGSSAGLMGEYCIDFICIPITPEPTWPTQLPTVVTNPPTPPTPYSRWICCDESDNGFFDNRNPDVWFKFKLDKSYPEIIFTTCDSDYNTRIDVYNDKEGSPIYTDLDGCNYPTGQALLEVRGGMNPNLDWWIKVSNEEPTENGVEWVLGIICPEIPTFQPPTPTPPPFITTTTPPAPTPSCIEIECFQRVSGNYNSQPITYELTIPDDEANRYYKIIEVMTCGSNFNSRVSLQRPEGEIIQDNCATESTDCQCDSCGDCDLDANGKIIHPCNYGDCNPPEEQGLPCCAYRALASGPPGFPDIESFAFEPENAMVHFELDGRDIPVGTYYITIDSPVSNTFGQYELYVACRRPWTLPPGPTTATMPPSPPTTPCIMRCNEKHEGPYADEPIWCPFILEQRYVDSDVVIDMCDSDFDTYLELYGTDNNGHPIFPPLYEDDDGCFLPQEPNTGSLMEFPNGNLVPDDYFVRISTPPAAFPYGTYIIKITCTPTGQPSPPSPPSPPSSPPTIWCGAVLEGWFWGDKLWWWFDNIYTTMITFNSCGSQFDTRIEQRNEDGTQVQKSCNNCGTSIQNGDCSYKLGYVCCDGQEPYNAEIRSAVTPSTYWFTLDFNANNPPQQYPVWYKVELLCEGVTMWPTSPSYPPHTYPPAPSPPVPSPPSYPPHTYPPFPTPPVPSPPTFPTPPSWPTPYPNVPAPVPPSTMRPTPRPTPRTLWPSPTPRPWPTPPQNLQCNDRCDAFSVTVEDWYYSGSNVCVRYNVKRLVSTGYYCRAPIKYFVLGVCNSNSIIDIDDINGLIHSCNIDGSDSIDAGSGPGWWDSDDSTDSRPKPKPKPKPKPNSRPGSRDSDDSNNNWNNANSNNPDSDSNRYPNWWGNNDDSGSGKKSKKWNRNSRDSDSDRRRRSLRWSSYSKKCFGTNADGLYGIMISEEVETEMSFEICFRNVFVTPIRFSNTVRFRRGYDKFTCYNDWTVGLPCIDPLKFSGGIGEYDSSGFNRRGKKWAQTYKKGRTRKYKSKGKGKKGYHSYDSAEGFGVQMVDNDALQTINPIVRWEVLSAVVLFSLCLIGVGIYCIVLRQKRKHMLRGHKVASIEMIEDEENDSDESDGSDDNENGDDDDDDDDNDSLEGNSNDKQSTKTKKFKRETFKREKFKREKYKATKRDEVEMQHLGDHSDSESSGYNDESTRF